MDSYIEFAARLAMQASNSIAALGILHTLINRAKNDRGKYGDSLRDIIQNHEYTNDLALAEPGQDHWLLAFLALGQHTVSPVGRATHYHIIGVTPGWADQPNMRFVSKVGNVKFYREA